METVDATLKTMLSEIERMLTTKTVVGEPITLEGYTIVPLVSIGFGVGAGGGSGHAEKQGGDGVGAGAGAGAKPIAVVIIGPDGVRVEPVQPGRIANLAGKLGDFVVQAVEKATSGRKAAE